MEDGQRRFTVDVEFPTSNRDALPWSGQLVLHLDVAAGMLAVEGVCLDGGTGKISFVEQEAALCFPLSSTVFSLTGEEGDESVVISGMCDAGIQVEFAVLVPAFARGDDLVQLLESGGATAVQERASGNGRKEEMRPAPINVSTPEHNYTRPASREALKSASVAGWPVSTKYLPRPNSRETPKTERPPERLRTQTPCAAAWSRSPAPCRVMACQRNPRRLALPPAPDLQEPAAAICRRLGRDGMPAPTGPTTGAS